MLAAAALAHSILIGLCIWQEQFELAAAWLIGNLMIYPLFGALRQLLEHRSADAQHTVDYAIQPHGKTTRSFKAGPVGTFFGGAGFRLHDIHHFDPELSYTNLAIVDAFLRNCDAVRQVRGDRKSYGRVALELWHR
jgi:fatty acid desaturase